MGFIKASETLFGVRYERENQAYGYVHCLDIMHKNNGNHLIQSYQKGVNTDGFNNMIGLTSKEATLAVKKMNQCKFDSYKIQGGIYGS